MVYLIYTPSALGSAALWLRVYISGKPLLPMLQLYNNHHKVFANTLESKFYPHMGVGVMNPLLLECWKLPSFNTIGKQKQRAKFWYNYTDDRSKFSLVTTGKAYGYIYSNNDKGHASPSLGISLLCLLFYPLCYAAVLKFLTYYAQY